MDPYAVSHLSKAALLHDLKTLDDRDRRTTALLLSRIVEVEERRLFLEEGYPSMYAYCIHELHYCEGTASRRIYAARAARRFPVLLDAVADGQLHVTAVVMLSRYLTSANVDELVAAATHKSKAEIAHLIAERFPQPDLPEVLQPIAPPRQTPTTTGPQSTRHSPENAVPAISLANPPAAGPAHEHSPENAHPSIAARQHSQENAAWHTPRPEPKPLAPERFGLQLTLDQEAHDLLQEARELMGHENPSAEILPVLKDALHLLVGHLRKRKFAATDRPGHSRPSSSPRHIPAAVKRAVWERDGGRCTFVGDSGKRCPARSTLEFDHEHPVARGGGATAENLRLLCRAHNQHAADGAFGAQFMNGKRSTGRERGRLRARVKTGSHP